MSQLVSRRNSGIDPTPLTESNKFISQTALRANAQLDEMYKRFPKDKILSSSSSNIVDDTSQSLDVISSDQTKKLFSRIDVMFSMFDKIKAGGIGNVNNVAQGMLGNHGANTKSTTHLNEFEEPRSQQQSRNNNHGTKKLNDVRRPLTPAEEIMGSFSPLPMSDTISRCSTAMSMNMNGLRRLNHEIDSDLRHASMIKKNAGRLYIPTLLGELRKNGSRRKEFSTHAELMKLERRQRTRDGRNWESHNRSLVFDKERIEDEHHRWFETHEIRSKKAEKLHEYIVQASIMEKEASLSDFKRERAIQSKQTWVLIQLILSMRVFYAAFRYARRSNLKHLYPMSQDFHDKAQLICGALCVDPEAFEQAEEVLRRNLTKLVPRWRDRRKRMATQAIADVGSLVHCAVVVQKWWKPLHRLQLSGGEMITLQLLVKRDERLQIAAEIMSKRNQAKGRKGSKQTTIVVSETTRQAIFMATEGLRLFGMDNYPNEVPTRVWSTVARHCFRCLRKSHRNQYRVYLDTGGTGKAPIMSRLLTPTEGHLFVSVGFGLFEAEKIYREQSQYPPWTSAEELMDTPPPPWRAQMLEAVYDGKELYAATHKVFHIVRDGVRREIFLLPKDL